MYTDIKLSLIDKGGSLCLNCLYTHVVYAKNLFSFWDSGTLVHAKQRAPTEAAPDTNLRREASLDRNMTYRLLRFCCWFKSVLSATVHEREKA